MKDEELLKGIHLGDENAAEELINRYYAPILRYCKSHCSDLTKAEDLTQETFLRVFRDIDSYEQRGSFRAYLYTIAHHLCIDENRKQTTFKIEDNISIEDNNLKKVEDRDQINFLLNLLNPAQREAIILHCGEQLSFREISQILDIPARTVQSRVRVALTILRKEK